MEQLAAYLEKNAIPYIFDGSKITLLETSKENIGFATDFAKDNGINLSVSFTA